MAGIRVLEEGKPLCSGKCRIKSVEGFENGRAEMHLTPTSGDDLIILNLNKDEVCMFREAICMRGE